MQHTQPVPAKKPLSAQVRKKILQADIIYVGDGESAAHGAHLAAPGVDRFLKQAYEKRVGLAGSICCALILRSIYLCRLDDLVGR